MVRSAGRVTFSRACRFGTITGEGMYKRGERLQGHEGNAMEYNRIESCCWVAVFVVRSEDDSENNAHGCSQNWISSPPLHRFHRASLFVATELHLTSLDSVGPIWKCLETTVPCLETTLAKGQSKENKEHERGRGRKNLRITCWR